ncbi:hypothetical protein [Arsenicicoccus dermatophilus]|uniref:hypothetical protein n=1 Tax=Arsenicicoccus dermatophilus TaxID=1076331 RepID=UPI001F4C8AF6|nr:hypothetical protein [Arsenicicoccus dermatophilus]MCH8611927.1 hypothetical protein [Arsenicicoccus dermatophilus]
MPQIQHGHEHHGRDAIISLDDALVGRLDRTELDRLVATIAQVVQHEADDVDLQPHLARAFEQAGLPQPEVVVARMAENLRNADEVTVVTDTGRVLLGDPSWTPATHATDVQGSEDPEHHDRPAYS